jgi:hypothetical protein
MTSGTRRLLFWTPRILTIVFILFLGLFALDVFSETQGFFRTALAFLIHLIPNFVLFGVLLVAWRWEWVGAVLFTGLGVFYLAETWGRFHWSAYAAISGPLLLVGVLFLLNWIFRDQVRNRTPRRAHG